MNPKIRATIVAAMSALMFSIGATNSFALNAGDLDPSFGNGGLVSLAVPPNYGYGTFDIATQPDGKILTAGYEQFMSGATSFAVQRFNADGSLDTTFGGGDGVASVQPAVANSSSANAVEVAPDGSIFLGGYRVVQSSPYLSEYVVVKFTAQGILDTSFDGDGENDCGANNGNGVVCTRVSASLAQDQGRAMVLQPNGYVVLAGTAYIDPTGPNRMGALRLTTTGARDLTFDGDGRVTASAGVDQSGFNSYANSISLQSDGKLVMAGVAQGEGNNHLGNNVYVDALGFVRLNANGSVDSGFKYTQPGFSGPPTANGVLISPRADWTYGALYSATVQPDGRILASGYANNVSPAPTASSAVTVRLGTDGTPDASYGSGGRAFLDLGNHNAGSQILTDSAGRIYMAGYYQPVLGTFEYAARLTTSGALDTTFNGVGWRKIDWGADVSAQSNGLALLPDGKLLVSGAGTGTPRSGLAKLITVSDPVPPPLLENPFAKISSPKATSMKAKNLHVLSGTAGPLGSVKKVEVALQRVDKKALKKKKRCYYLQASKAKFKSVKATKGKCSKPYFRPATGTTKWKYRITKTLPKGSYALSVKVMLTDGRKTTTFTKSGGNYLAFKLK
jgi:uncharacterized delta-60 repeat protein